MPKITDPVQIKSMRLRNRLIMAPMATGMAKGGHVGDAHIRWYAEPVRAGVSLVVVEASGIDPSGQILPNQIGVWDDAFLPGLKKLAASIHVGGARAIVQLVHGGGKSWRDAGDLSERLAPSAEVLLAPGAAPREITKGGIQSVIDSFAAAARRAKTAGFDGVEVHGAHYFLVSQFLSPLTNRRTDRWGGGLEGRSRLLVETVRAIRAETGNDFVISARLHAVELFDGGMPVEDSVRVAGILKTAGADFINASGVGSASWEVAEGQMFLQTTSAPPATGNPGIYVPFAAKLRACGLPVAAVGRLAEPGAAQAALEGGVDMVAIARQIIADPQSPKKLLMDRHQDINPCSQCLSCFQAIRAGGIRCPLNAAWVG